MAVITSENRTILFIHDDPEEFFIYRLARAAARARVNVLRAPGVSHASTLLSQAELRLVVVACPFAQPDMAAALSRRPRDCAAVVVLPPELLGCPGPTCASETGADYCFRRPHRWEDYCELSRHLLGLCERSQIRSCVAECLSAQS